MYRMYECREGQGWPGAAMYRMYECREGQGWPGAAP
jgi:hypothetical protein